MGGDVLLLDLKLQLFTAHINIPWRDDPYANLSPLDLFNDDADLITNPDRLTGFTC